MARAAAIELTALEHLQELVRRVLWSVGFMIAGGSLSYIYRLQIIEYLQHPLRQNLYYTSPMGSFQFVMQVCMLCGLLCALPILLYNILRFIEPAFSQVFTRKMVVAVLSASLFLTFAGAAFAYYITLPAALRFFNTVGTNHLHALISVNEYFSFILGYLATFAIVFQLPLVVLFIDHIKPFDPGALSSKRKFVYVGAFAISLIMPSSPDPLSQVSLAIPIITLYELSIFLVWLSRRKRMRKAARAQQSAIAQQFGTSDDAVETGRPVFDFANTVPIMAAAQSNVNISARPSLDPPVQAAPRPQNTRGHAASVTRRSSVAVSRANYQSPNRTPRPIRDIL